MTENTAFEKDEIMTSPDEAILLSTLSQNGLPTTSATVSDTDVMSVQVPVERNDRNDQLLTVSSLPLMASSPKLNPAKNHAISTETPHHSTEKSHGNDHWWTVDNLPEASPDMIQVISNQTPQHTTKTSNGNVKAENSDRIHVVSTQKSSGGVFEEDNSESDSEEDEDEEGGENTRKQKLTNLKKKLSDFKSRYAPVAYIGLKSVLIALYFCYFGYAMYHEFGTEASLRLLGGTAIGILVLSYGVVSKYITAALRRLEDTKVVLWIRKITRWILYIAMAVFAVIYIVINVALKKPGNLASLAGMAGYIIICCLMSHRFLKIRWNCVFWGISGQFLMAIVVMQTSWGIQAITWASDRVQELMAYGQLASAYVFGKSYRDHFLLFSAFPLILFIGSFITVLYHIGIMEWVVSVVGRTLSFCLNCTIAESMSVAANIFLGNAQACLAIRPYLAGMKSAEVFALLVGGLSSVSASAMAQYIAFGADAKHIITACIMSAPAALAVAKIVYPEKRKVTAVSDIRNIKIEKYNNVMEAAARGATDSINVFVQVLINLYVFYGLLQFMNTTVGWFGLRVGLEDFSFQYLCSYLLFPLPLLMGVSIDECRGVAKVLAVKLVAGNSVGFLTLGDIKRNNAEFLEYTVNPNNTWHYAGDDLVLDSLNKTLAYGVLSPRSVTIVTYAMCGYSNFSSVGITLGTMMVLIPKKKKFLSKMIVKCMVAGNIACYLTACIAGLFFEA